MSWLKINDRKKSTVVFLLAKGGACAEVMSRVTVRQPSRSAWRRSRSRWSTDFTFKGANCTCCFSRAAPSTRGPVTSTERRVNGKSGARVRYSHLCHTLYETSTDSQTSNTGAHQCSLALYCEALSAQHVCCVACVGLYHASRCLLK